MYSITFWDATHRFSVTYLYLTTHGHLMSFQQPLKNVHVCCSLTCGEAQHRAWFV